MRHQGSRRQGKPRRIITATVVVIAAVAIAVGVIIYKISAHHVDPLPVSLPPASASYLGVFTKGMPDSYDGVTAFSSAIGTQPDVVMYYSGWYVPFPVSFATTAANNGAVPLVQVNPDHISVAAIAAGKYDGYLSAYAEAVRAYRHPVIMSFGHEMNGHWYLLGLRQHIADGFRRRLASHRHALPRARSPKCDVAVDGEHHQQHAGH